MSRTDKDRPRRVIDSDETMGLIEYHDHRTGVCGLFDAADDDGTYEHIDGTRYVRRRCYRELDGSYHWYAFSEKSTPDRLYRREFHARERAQTREALHRLIAEYRGSGDVDDTPVQPRDHRHSALWDWW